MSLKSAVCHSNWEQVKVVYAKEIEQLKRQAQIELLEELFDILHQSSLGWVRGGTLDAKLKSLKEGQVK